MKFSGDRIDVREWIGLTTIIIHASALYGFLGMVAGFPSVRLVSIFSMLVIFLYVALRINTAIKLLSYTPIFLFLVFIWLIPIFLTYVQAAVGIVTTERFIYWSGFLSLSGLLAVSSSIIGFLSTQKFIKLVFLLILMITFGEFVINIVDYDFTRKVLIFINSVRSGSLSQGRLTGFFPHPNQAAISITIFCFVIVYHQRTSLVFGSIVVAACLLMILLTGSRTSLILMFIVSSLMMTREFFRSESGFVKVIIVILVAIPLLLLLFKILSLAINAQFLVSMTDRVQSIFFIFSETSAGDASVNLRSQAIQDYAHIIGNNPLLGIGFDGVSNQIEAGNLQTTSQNTWIQWAAEFGIIYSLIGVLTFFVIYSWANRMKNFNSSGRTLKYYIIILAISSFSIDDIFNIRVITVVMGVLLGQAVRTKTRLAMSVSGGASAGRNLP